MKKTLFLILVLCCLPVLACGLLEPEVEGCGPDAMAGCAVVRGVVTDSVGTPLSGITVAARYPAREGCCWGVHDETGKSGTYWLSIGKDTPRADPNQPDTVSVYLIAFTKALGAIDTVLAIVEFGGDWPVTEVDLILPLPTASRAALSGTGVH